MNKEILIILSSSLRQLADSIENLTNDISDEPTIEQKDQKQIKKEETVTIEQVRAVLAEKSQTGKQQEVKSLILKYGANKLTDIDPSKYKALLKEAEEL